MALRYFMEDQQSEKEENQTVKLEFSTRFHFCLAACEWRGNSSDQTEDNRSPEGIVQDKRSALGLEGKSSLVVLGNGVWRIPPRGLQGKSRSSPVFQALLQYSCLVQLQHFEFIMIRSLTPLFLGR